MSESESITKALEEVLGNDKYRNKLIVKPSSFIYSQFTNRPWYYTKKREDIVHSMNARLLDPLTFDYGGSPDVEIEETHYDVAFFPVVPETLELMHTTVYSPNGLFVNSMHGRKRIPAMDKSIKRTGIFGSQDEKIATYLKDISLSEHTDCGGHCAPEEKAVIVDLYIEVQELLKWRNIFYDPETLVGGKEEFKKTFIVFGGIPNQAISGFKIQ